MKITCVDPRVDPLWKRLVEQQRSDLFHSPAWSSVLADTYGFEPLAYVLTDDANAPLAGVPFVPIADIRGQRKVTLPFSDYCDPLAADAAAWNALLEQFVDPVTTYKIRCVHNDIPLDDARLSLVNRAKWHGLSLEADLDELWMGLEGSARRAVRKAEQQDVVVRPAANLEDLRVFYELHVQIRKQKYRMVAQPGRFFEYIWRHFVEQQRGTLLMAEHNGTIVGTTMLLIWKDRLYYKFNASTLTDLAIRPNDLMIWRGIQYGKEQGLTYLDLGLSDWDQDGLIRYKRKYAHDERTISFLQTNHEPAQQSAAADDFGALLSQLTDLMTDSSVPDHITASAGDLLYRYFT